VTPDAEKRLEAIMLHTELGSGFQVATYDLEIRGAGNLLGDDQSGHVAAVGLDLYTELLEEAIDEIRGSVFDDDIEPEVNVPIEAFIPEEYIPATSLRLMFYKRFSLSTTTDELYETFGELADRFGEPPESVKNLRDIIELKVRLRGLKAKRFDAGPSSMSMELLESTPIQPAKLLAFISETRGKIRLTKDMKLIYKFNPEESANVLQTAHDLMETLRRLT
jgi:transcription-repair coupling factor (superfamily II helicase)